MRFQHILQAIYSEPWLIKPQAHGVIREFMARRLAGDQPPKREDGEFCGDKVEVAQAEEIKDGVYLIPVGGILARKVGKFERAMGVVDTLDIRDELDWAEESKDIHSIVMDFDSPGGIVTGTPELADRIAAVDKPLFAFTGSMMCSAAYWLAAGAKRIYATKGADIGSIGVYIPFYDESAAYENAGVKVEMFRSGDYKGMGFPGTSLTDAQRKQLQGEVITLANDFQQHILSLRDVPIDAMQGQSFMGNQALANGLIDELVGGIEDVLSLL
jgi:signal peptide peptidase SppA